MKCTLVHTLAALLLAVGALGCPGPSPTPGTPVPRYHDRSASPPGNNWPISARRAERLFTRGQIEMSSAKPTETGVAGAYKAEVEFPPDPRPVTIKWKPASGGDMDDWNNNPRKEVAAYVIQQWFLEPRDYVVPTTAVRCAPLPSYRRIDPEAAPTIDGTRCVLGMVSLWLDHVTVPETLYDPERFARDYRYAYHLADFNVLAYLIRHRDGRAGNILVADDDANRRVFAVDNGISFDGLVYNFLVSNWDEIRVPAIRREVVEELRDVDREDLDELGTLVELRADKQGVLRAARPTTPIDPTQGIRTAPGRVQMGLTTAEIDGLAARIRALLERVDQGTLAVF
jgi:hypothetical protein